MASKRHLWGEVWVQVPLTIVVIIAVLGVWIVRATRRLSALAAADVAASPASGPVAFGADYRAPLHALHRRESLLGALVLVAVFFMAAKP